MKLKQYSDLEIESSEEIGVDLEVAMTNQTAGHIIRALSNTIYKDKPGSMVREMTSNAWDANKEAGSDEPVYLEISDNQLVIKDSGPGFSEERIKEVFINFGESTKRDSNDEIGGFGIGSKTPLAYTSDFTLRTWVDGTEYVYLVHKTNDLPKVKLVDKLDAPGEPNGTEAIIAIKPGDKDTIMDAIRKQLLYFNNLVVLGVPGWENDMKIHQGDHFLYNDTMPPRQTNICLGQVAYPLDRELVEIAMNNVIRDLQYNHGDLDSIVGKFMDLRLGVKFEIGEIPVVLSREEIEYGEGVKSTVIARLEEVIQELLDMYEEQALDLESDEDNMTFFEHLVRDSGRKLRIGDYEHNMDAWFFLRVPTNNQYQGLSEYKFNHSLKQVLQIAGAGYSNSARTEANYGSIYIKGHYISMPSNGENVYTSNKMNFATQSIGTFGNYVLLEGEDRFPNRKIRYHSMNDCAGQDVKVMRIKWQDFNDLCKKSPSYEDYRGYVEEFIQAMYDMGAVKASSIQVPKGWGINKVKKNLRIRAVHAGRSTGTIYEYKDFTNPQNSYSVGRTGPWVLMVHADKDQYDKVAEFLDVNIAYCAKADYERLLQTGTFMTFEEYMMERPEFREAVTLYYIGRTYNQYLVQFNDYMYWARFKELLSDEQLPDGEALHNKLESKHFKGYYYNDPLVQHYLDYIGGNLEYINFFKQEWISIAELFVEMLDAQYIEELACVQDTNLKARIYLKLFKDDKITHEYIKKHLIHQDGDVEDSDPDR